MVLSLPLCLPPNICLISMLYNTENIDFVKSHVFVFSGCAAVRV